MATYESSVARQDQVQRIATSYLTRAAMVESPNGDHNAIRDVAPSLVRIMSNVELLTITSELARVDQPLLPMVVRMGETIANARRRSDTRN